MTAGPRSFQRIVRLLMLTGARLSEVACMRGREISALDDPMRAMWIVPAERAKNGRARTIPLVETAREVVREAFAERGCDPDAPLFGRGREGFSGFSNAKRALDRRLASLRARDAGLDPETLSADELRRYRLAPWRPHDLRRTIGTHLVECGVPVAVVAHVLGHVDPTVPRVTAVHYLRARYHEPMRHALTLWERSIRAAAGEHVAKDRQVEADASLAPPRRPASPGGSSGPDRPSSDAS